MGLIRRIADWIDPIEVRAQDPSWDAIRLHGHTETPREAEQLSTVLACVNAISSNLASLPAYVYRTQTGDRIEQEDHPLVDLIRQGPNPHQSWPDFIECLAASVLLRGNGVARVDRNGSGAVGAMRFVPWEWCHVDILPSGRLRYSITDPMGIWGRPGARHIHLQEEMLHIRHRSDDGIIGRSPLSRAKAVVSASHNVNEFASAMFRNGVHPSGVLMAEGMVNREGMQSLREQFERAFQGPSKAAKAMVLDQGVKWQSVSVSPEDAELLASRRFTTEELARIYNVPPPMIGDLTNGTFTNSETMLRYFAQGCLNHWVRKLEAEFTRSVFTDPSYSLEMDLSGLLRGDPETRWASHKIAVDSGILDADEVRQAEGWNRRSV